MNFRLLGCVIAAALLPGAAYAGVVVPAPLAGAFGPAGLVVGGVAYLGYLGVKRLRRRR